MKKAALVLAAAFALGTISAPAFAADNKNSNKPTKTVLLEITGTVAQRSPIVVTVKSVSRPDGAKDASATVRASDTITVTTDTATVFRRESSTAVSTLAVGDHVAIRATCTNTTCKASRITATPGQTKVAASASFNFALTGVIKSVAGDASSIVVVPISVETAKDSPLNLKTYIGKDFTALTNGSTVVVNRASVSALTAWTAVTVAGTCTSAVPAVCTATRIAVLAS